MGKKKTDVVTEIREFLDEVFAREYETIRVEIDSTYDEDVRLLHNLEDIGVVASQIRNEDDRKIVLKTFAQIFENEPGYKEKWRP